MERPKPDADYRTPDDRQTGDRRPRSTQRAPGTSTPLDMRWTRLALPDPDVPSTPVRWKASAWRPRGCCCRQPDLLLLDEPTNHLDAESVQWLERFTWPATRARCWPSPATGTSSTTSPVDPRARPRARHIPYEGNYSTYLETKKDRLRWPRAPRTPSDRRGCSSASWSGCASNPKARQAKSKARLARTRSCCGGGGPHTKTPPARSIAIPPRAHSRRHRARGRRPAPRASATSSSSTT